MIVSFMKCVVKCSFYKIKMSQHPEVDLNQNQILNQDQILNQNQIVNQEQILNQERKTRAKERKERKEEILKKLRASKEVINESPLI